MPHIGQSFYSQLIKQRELKGCGLCEPMWSVLRSAEGREKEVSDISHRSGLQHLGPVSDLSLLTECSGYVTKMNGCLQGGSPPLPVLFTLFGVATSFISTGLAWQLVR